MFWGGLFFAKTMRSRKYVTMMDPFQIKYGKVISGILSLGLLLSDIIWVTGTLIGLGKWLLFCFLFFCNEMNSHIAWLIGSSLWGWTSDTTYWSSPCNPIPSDMSRSLFKGATMSVILGLSYSVCIWISAVVAITYTLLGGLYSVAYTDIIQLTLIFFSLVSSSPGHQNKNSSQLQIYQPQLD